MLLARNGLTGPITPGLLAGFVVWLLRGCAVFESGGEEREFDAETDGDVRPLEDDAVGDGRLLEDEPDPVAAAVGGAEVL